MPALQQRDSMMGQDPHSISIQSDFISLASICVFLTLLVTTLRVFTKMMDIRRVLIEDYIIMFSTIGFTIFVAVMFVAAQAGLPLSSALLSFEQYKRAVMYSSALDIIYAPTMFAAKVAILIQLDRLSQTWKQVVYWSVRFLLVINALCYAGIFIVQIINGDFNSKMSKRAAPGFRDTRSFTAYTSGTTNIISNVVILMLAVVGVAMAQFSVRRWILLALMLAIGCFTCISSIIKLVYEARVDGSSDFTATAWPVYMWSVGELTSIIYCACSPTFPRLLQYIQGRSPATTSTSAHKKWANIAHSRSGSAMSNFEFEPLKKSDKPTMGRRYYSKPSASHVISRSNSSRSIHTSLARTGSNRNSSRSIYHDTAVRNASRNSFRDFSPAPIQPKKSLRRAPIHQVDASQRLSTAFPSQYPFSSQPTFPLIPSTPVYTIPEHETPVTPITPGSPTQTHFPISPTLTHSTSWPSPTSTTFPGGSPTQTEFSVAEVGDATHVRMQPVYFATIRKTVDVRVSTHTAPDSPMTWRKGSMGW